MTTTTIKMTMTVKESNYFKDFFGENGMSPYSASATKVGNVSWTGINYRLNFGDLDKNTTGKAYFEYINPSNDNITKYDITINLINDRHAAGFGGTNGHDHIDGTTSGNKITGLAGNDLIHAGGGNDNVNGGDGIDYVFGQGGNDKLDGGAGNDMVNGGVGNDFLGGGLGADLLYGGTGADTFFFRNGESTVSTSGRDTIKDFNQSEGDLLDLSRIDANSTIAGDQEFMFLEKHNFTGHAGELRYINKDGKTTLYGDFNGDQKVDMAIHFDSTINFKLDDFFLL